MKSGRGRQWAARALAAVLAGWCAAATAGERERAWAAWGTGGKRAEVAHAEEVEWKLNGRLEGGYLYRDGDLEKVKKALRAYNAAIDGDLVDEVAERREAADEALRLFEAGCRWRAGMRNREDPHLLSGDREGQWVAERGYVIVPSGPGTCPDCGGSGGGVREMGCGVCGGTGRLGEGATMGAWTFWEAPVCSQCQGRGRVTGRWVCGRCGGDGVL